MRSLRYQLRVPRFPVHRELDHFQWEESDVDRERLEPLADTEFTQDAHNLILVAGTGKTRLATTPIASDIANKPYSLVRIAC